MREVKKLLKGTSRLYSNRNALAGILIITGTLVASFFTATLSIEMSFWHLTAIWTATLCGAWWAFQTTLRWSSPSLVYSDGTVLSRFSTGYELIHDLGTHWLLQPAMGFNPSASLWASKDIEPFQKRATVTMIPARMVEQMGNGRYRIARGVPLWCNASENAMLSQRPAIGAALKRMGIKDAQFVMTFSSLDWHEHEPLAHPDLEAVEREYQNLMGELRSAKREIGRTARTDIEIYRLYEKNKPPIPAPAEERK